MRNLAILLVLFVSSGCTAVKYNGAIRHIKDVNYPEIGVTETAFVGDHLISSGSIIEEEVLYVHETIDGALYHIPAGKYLGLGYDDLNYFYSASGVTYSAWADPLEALALEKEGKSRLCVVSIYSAKTCYSGDYERKTEVSARGDSFQQTLLYSGRVGDKINISYREFSNNFARPAFNNEVEYDLSSSKTIGYKGAVIEVMEADNNSITYRVLKSFRK